MNKPEIDSEDFIAGEDVTVNFVIETPQGMMVGVKFKGEDKDLLLAHAAEIDVPVTKLVHALVCAYLRL